MPRRILVSFFISFQMNLLIEWLNAFHGGKTEILPLFTEKREWD